MKAIFFYALIPFLIPACTTSPEKENHLHPTASVQTTSGTYDSSIEIEYNLGRDHYRYFANQKDQLASAQTLLGGKILAQGTVDVFEYQRFLKNAVSFIQSSQPAQSSSKPFCRNAFKMVLNTQGQNYVLHGCRNSNPGALSRLIKQGEFLLLYSKS